ncbi:hypothetical protein L2E82_14083 [Cichorium intybus]|uniref:Uncharacterized protein n=1 Tax=Cichorium intybus TaxID=13427 RepID=A0ACB9EZM2_CICIN|nr:hypothetical protein L2E82_14083 [Cichorium intybus]
MKTVPQNWSLWISSSTTRLFFHGILALKGHLAEENNIPFIYRIDAAHGHINVNKSTIFPHNVNLGVTRQV